MTNEEFKVRRTVRVLVRELKMRAAEEFERAAAFERAIGLTSDTALERTLGMQAAASYDSAALELRRAAK